MEEAGAFGLRSSLGSLPSRGPGTHAEAGGQQGGSSPEASRLISLHPSELPGPGLVSQVTLKGSEYPSFLSAALRTSGSGLEAQCPGLRPGVITSPGLSHLLWVAQLGLHHPCCKLKPNSLRLVYNKACFFYFHHHHFFFLEVGKKKWKLKIKTNQDTGAMEVSGSRTELRVPGIHGGRTRRSPATWCPESEERGPDVTGLHFQRCLTREDSSLMTSGSRGAWRHRQGSSSRTMRTSRMSPQELMSA